ncbi:MAG: hypothetical protein MJA29_08040, partial [Candidatus Omnitrophica bacterium]|nr:hypothetical protein [Candidatus Omnitrophota bacterium]
LFIMFINDLSSAVISDLFLFADDSTLINVFSDATASIVKLNTDLLAIDDWAKTWLVDFNPNKTEAMTFSAKRVASTANGLYFSGKNVIEVVTHKHLGIIFNQRLNWSDHIDYVTSKCMKRINILRKLKNRLPRKTLCTLYFTMIQSVIEYGIVVYYNRAGAVTLKLDNIQYQACILICGALKFTSFDRLRGELGWPKIHERADFLKASLFYKIVNGLTPSHFSEFILNKCTRQFQPRDVRFRHELLPPFGRTDRYCTSFIPSACRIWNSLPDTVISARSLSSFKMQYKKHYFMKPIVGFDSGDRSVNIFHTRFRLHFTTLNYDLYLRNLCESSSCQCGATVETYAHYFLYCPLYIDARRDLLQIVDRLFLSCGLELSSFSDDSIIDHFVNGFGIEFQRHNISLFTAVQQFITATNRFR